MLHMSEKDKGATELLQDLLKILELSHLVYSIPEYLPQIQLII